MQLAQRLPRSEIDRLLRLAHSSQSGPPLQTHEQQPTDAHPANDPLGNAQLGGHETLPNHPRPCWHASNKQPQNNGEMHCNEWPSGPEQRRGDSAQQCPSFSPRHIQRERLQGTGPEHAGSKRGLPGHQQWQQTQAGHHQDHAQGSRDADRRGLSGPRISPRLERKRAAADKSRAGARRQCQNQAGGSSHAAICSRTNLSAGTADNNPPPPFPPRPTNIFM